MIAVSMQISRVNESLVPLVPRLSYGINIDTKTLCHFAALKEMFQGFLNTF